MVRMASFTPQTFNFSINLLAVAKRLHDICQAIYGFGFSHHKDGEYQFVIRTSTTLVSLPQDAFLYQILDVTIDRILRTLQVLRRIFNLFSAYSAENMTSILRKYHHIFGS